MQNYNKIFIAGLVVRRFFLHKKADCANNNNAIYNRQVIFIYKKDYKKYTEKTAAKSNVFISCLKAFIAGGAICTFAQWLYNSYLKVMSVQNTKLLVPVTLIFITALTTGLGWFDKLAKHTGAGTFVPITGFANSIVSSALDSKSEGWILGLGAKIFTVAGPVILYGTLASTIYGIILYFIGNAGGGGAV